jgi:hypothetical protein
MCYSKSCIVLQIIYYETHTKVSTLNLKRKELLEARDEDNIEIIGTYTGFVGI